MLFICTSNTLIRYKNNIVIDLKSHTLSKFNLKIEKKKKKN